MPIMSGVESAFCRSRLWRGIQARALLPWVLGHTTLRGDGLEIGGGAGGMGDALLERYPDLRLTVTDFDTEMVRHARERLRKYGPRVRVQQADAQRLPYGDATFDVVLSFIMLHHLEDWRVAISEARRVLRPGGSFVGCDLAAQTLWTAAHRTWGSPIAAMVRPDDMRTRLGELRFGDVTVATTLPGVIFRFEATADTPSARQP